jgi:hypothetical protein
VEERAEKAADQRFCLNRMPGGLASPVTLMLSSIDPRRRSNGVAGGALSWDDYDRAWDGVVDVIARERSSDGLGLVAELAGMDMTVHSVARKDGSQFMWSRRDAIGGATARGELGVTEFAAFLEAMGETVIWPED